MGGADITEVVLLKRCLCLLVIAIGVQTQCAWADDVASTEAGAAQLDRFMNDLQSMQAAFTQTVKDSNGKLVEQSNGTLSIKKPGKFHWDYARPNAQTIVSDGKRLWLFDPELEQVTIRRAELSINGTPAVLLSGQGNWRDSFVVNHVENHDGMTVINLDPKQTDSDFKLLQLALRNNTLVAMSLTDKLAQTTLLEFKNFKRNGKVSDSEFNFVPPKNADVIDNTGAAHQ